MRHDGALAATLPASSKPRKADEAYDKLKRMIVNLRIAPGAPLDERALMTTLKIGRTPLREAIQRLTLEQLVTNLPRRGYYVQDLSISALSELITARHVIEPPVARLAVPHIGPAEIERLREIVAMYEAELNQRDHEAAIYYHLEFHRWIAAASGNRYLAAAAIQINTRLLRYWFISFSMPYEPQRFDHHGRLVDLIEARDEVAVEAAMHDHIDMFRDRAKQLVGIDAEFLARREVAGV